ncbi:MAG: hypothetical protein RR505_03595 [Raoultibacter sp.]
MKRRRAWLLGGGAWQTRGSTRKIGHSLRGIAGCLKGFGTRFAKEI